MPRPGKRAKACRTNGGKASNKGKLSAELVAVIKVKYTVRGRSVLVGFEKVFRARLHRNEKYLDEQRADEQLAAAARVVRACYLPGHVQESDGGKACAAAHATLNAYEAAMGGAE